MGWGWGDNETGSLLNLIILKSDFRFTNMYQKKTHYLRHINGQDKSTFSTFESAAAFCKLVPSTHSPLLWGLGVVWGSIIPASFNHGRLFCQVKSSGRTLNVLPVQIGRIEGFKKGRKIA